MGRKHRGKNHMLFQIKLSPRCDRKWLGFIARLKAILLILSDKPQSLQDGSARTTTHLGFYGHILIPVDFVDSLLAENHVHGRGIVSSCGLRFLAGEQCTNAEVPLR
jgi:hypothetical protein